MVSLASRPVEQLLPERCHDWVVAVPAALEQLGDRQCGDGLVAVEEPRPVGHFPPATGSLGGGRDDPAVDLQVHEAVADPDRHEEPLPPRGATGEPPVGWKPGNPGVYDGSSRNPGSQITGANALRLPPTHPPSRGESAEGGSPPRLPQTGPDTGFVPGGQGVEGSSRRPDAAQRADPQRGSALSAFWGPPNGLPEAR